MFLDGLPSNAVVFVEPAAPLPVARFSGLAGGIHDIGEEHGRENALDIGVLGFASPGDEFLDVAGQSVEVADPGRMITAGILDELRAGYAFDILPAEIDRSHGVAFAV